MLMNQENQKFIWGVVSNEAMFNPLYTLTGIFGMSCARHSQFSFIYKVVERKASSFFEFQMSTF